MASGSGNSSRQNQSDVWQYFRKDGSKNVVCALCKGKFAFHGGTFNLHDHLQRSHAVVYAHNSKIYI